MRNPDLTPRQRTFLDKLVEVYREQKAPVHYTDVASRLGVNRFSAYDMLKVLENKGFASSSYAFAAGHAGPGRSLVVFRPTRKATSVPGMVSDTSGGEYRLSEDWHGLRERVLGKLHAALSMNPKDAVNDLLARLPEARSPLAYCTEMIGILLVNMRRVKARAGALSPYRILVTLKTSGLGLEALPGLSMGASLADQDDGSPSLSERLLDHIQRYQTSLSRLNAEARTVLTDFLDEALKAID
jgi:hypothetical protein